MVKFSAEYISHLDDIVKCDCCGKKMRLGERICNIPGNACAECVKEGYRGNDRKNFKRRRN